MMTANCLSLISHVQNGKKVVFVVFYMKQQDFAHKLKHSGNSQFLSVDLRKQGRKIAEMRNCIPPSDPPPISKKTTKLCLVTTLCLLLAFKNVG